MRDGPVDEKARPSGMMKLGRNVNGYRLQQSQNGTAGMQPALLANSTHTSVISICEVNSNDDGAAYQRDPSAVP